MLLINKELLDYKRIRYVISNRLLICCGFKYTYVTYHCIAKNYPRRCCYATDEILKVQIPIMVDAKNEVLRTVTFTVKSSSVETVIQLLLD